MAKDYSFAITCCLARIRTLTYRARICRTTIILQGNGSAKIGKRRKLARGLKWKKRTLLLRKFNILAEYTYRGDKMTDPLLKGVECNAVRRSDGKCIRGRNGNMLVIIMGKKTVVMARQLRKFGPYDSKP